MKKEELSKIPAVDKLLNHPEILKLKEKYGLELVTYAVRQTLKQIRAKVLEGEKAWDIDQTIEEIRLYISIVADKSLKPMINATGIILHTNLGRAPLGKAVLKKLEPIITEYSNLEFDLEAGKRGHRNTHISELIKFVTKAEDAVVVNNNAAGVLLCLKTFAENKEAIISRGELIEIGGSFRIPEIMRTSGAKMVEVGTTNRTRLSDYKNAITENTRIILKAHKSNYYIGGFTEEVEIGELSKLAKKHNLILIYDIGSGLLRKLKGLPLKDEPDVRSSLEAGVDIITFSCDKLLGGPQAGIVAGKKELISKIAKTPLMRALRVGKMTISALSTVLRYYIKEENLLSKVPIFMLLKRTKTELHSLAQKLLEELKKYNIKAKVVESTAHSGGGTLPRLKIDSYSVMLISPKNEKKIAESVFKNLLKLERPILGILREGNIHFDVLTIFEEDIPYISREIHACLPQVENYTKND
ncbi:MAG: L-seryl-tRNA(Sec) selenium transferase [Candidatus Cloacimonetes bacterium]|nr:L-seryl-tRNA(Sec) selenium transferase [Candidatus Cloacimonadota bacterium]